MRACPEMKYVVSIQGLVSVYARYYYAGLSLSDILKNITLRDVSRWDTIFHGKRNFVQRGELEKEYIRRTRHVIGRTSWDHAHTKVINPDVTYHFCNEILRYGFYKAEKWTLENARKHTIFLSQAGYPIKGLHQVLKAVALLREDFPDIKVRVAGHNIVDKCTLAARLRMNGYGSYIDSLIKKSGLERHVEFTGPLSEEQMIKPNTTSTCIHLPIQH